MAAGAADVLQAAGIHARLETALADCVHAVGFSARPRDLSHRVEPLREAAPAIVEAGRAGRVALVFGNETSGLSNEELARCQRFVTIPANPAYGSLNLAAAVQVACYEIATTAHAFDAPQSRERAAATVDDVEGFFAHLDAATQASGYIDPASPGRFMERMRRLFARAGLERDEVRVMRGMLAAFERRMRRD
jgi:tRNA/rRNA methyltransferase